LRAVLQQDALFRQFVAEAIRFGKVAACFGLRPGSD